MEISVLVSLFQQKLVWKSLFWSSYFDRFAANIRLKSERALSCTSRSVASVPFLTVVRRLSATDMGT